VPAVASRRVSATSPPRRARAAASRTGPAGRGPSGAEGRSAPRTRPRQRRPAETHLARSDGASCDGRAGGGPSSPCSAARAQLPPPSTAGDGATAANAGRPGETHTALESDGTVSGRDEAPSLQAQRGLHRGGMPAGGAPARWRDPHHREAHAPASPLRALIPCTNHARYTSSPSDGASASEAASIVHEGYTPFVGGGLLALDGSREDPKGTTDVGDDAGASPGR